jgi:hypothetical protein
MSKVLAAALILAATQAYAQGRADVPNRSAIRLADNAALCAQIRAKYQQCKASWQNIGGGDTGQAGAFKQCMEVYYNAGIAAGCWQ